MTPRRATLCRPLGRLARAASVLLLSASASAPARAGAQDRAAFSARPAAPAPVAPGPAELLPRAEIELARGLRQRTLPFAAFFFAARIVEAGPAHPDFLEAVEETARAGEALGDEVFAPNLLRKAYGAAFARLPPDVLSRIDAQVALLAYRAGDFAEASRHLQGVGADAPAFARARLLQGLLAQREQPERAVEIFREVLRLRTEGAARDLPALQELAHLDLGRTLYGLHRYVEASAEYAALPRFSRHWDEALFEGAYADLKAGEKGRALGRLHGLHSPHLSDEFAPESENLAALLYIGNCLYPQAREALKRFEVRYPPLRDRLRTLLAQDFPLERWVDLLRGETGLPLPVRRHLRKNERVDSMLGYLTRLDEESARVGAAADLPRGVSMAELRDILANQRALAAQVAGKFIRGRIADLVRLIDLLERDKDLIAFETAKGEKALLESNVDLRAALGRQRLLRPEMPNTGHEYWPFDGEYWPDEIGYYRYTLKDACPATAKDERR